jgi:Transcriptional regulators
VAKYATLKDVAQRAGTTAGTVSYVLNNKSGRYISDETRKKVLEAAKELDYIKCAGASSLKGKSRKLLSILVPQFENQFFTRLVIAAEKVFMEYGYDLLISNTDDNPEKEKEILERMVGQRVEGFLVTPTTEGGANTEFIRKHEIPMVIIDRPLSGVENYCWITTDNYRCGYVGADYLAKMGHEKIGYVGWNSGIQVLDSRCNAVFDALRANGRTTEYLKVENEEFSYDGGYRATRKLISENPDLTAIFYGFNVQASGGVNCLRDIGIKVPDDLSVTLVGSPEWAYTGLNNFTHVDMGEAELGRRAALALLAQIAGKNRTQEKQRMVQDCSLVPGATVRKIG